MLMLDDKSTYSLSSSARREPALLGHLCDSTVDLILARMMCKHLAWHGKHCTALICKQNYLIYSSNSMLCRYAIVSCMPETTTSNSIHAQGGQTVRGVFRGFHHLLQSSCWLLQICSRYFKRSMPMIQVKTVGFQLIRSSSWTTIWNCCQSFELYIYKSA